MQPCVESLPIGPYNISIQYNPEYYLSGEFYKCNGWRGVVVRKEFDSTSMVGKPHFKSARCTPHLRRYPLSSSCQKVIQTPHRIVAAIDIGNS